MRIETVLVTGASGKLGRSLVPALLKAGYRVRATQFRTPVRVPGAQIVTGSISDPGFARRALKGVDAVCHLATCKEDPAHFVDVSLKGTLALLDEARRRGGLKQFILASGDAALGIFFYPRPRPLDESAPLAAYPGCYAFSKVMEEVMVGQYHIQYALPSTVLRISWIHGDDDLLAHMTLRPPNFGGPAWRDLARTARQKEIFRKRREAVGCLLHPNGQPFIRHIVGISDVVQSFLLALGNPAAIGQTFNIAGPAAFSYGPLSAHIAARLGVPVVPFVCRAGNDFRINIGKARSVLGYDPKWDANRIADEAIAWRLAGGRRAPLRYRG
ncbi:MAG: NAD(P)-dependent oxidoreductase [Candidatus Hydrogenedentes bacterium]|nr:NAD(P)-dependent oxidoreductase [Candidatus Hydrogenedentota bacterium]